MKKLFTFLCALALTGSAFAQSSWNEGDEITSEVSWGNLSFENDPMDCWIYTQTTGSNTTTGGLFETYDGSDCDLYQIVKLPAGMYEVTCQGYYRWGTSWDEDPNQYGKDAWENNAVLRVATGKYDIDSQEFTEERTFKNPLMPRLFEECYEQLYQDVEQAAGWDMSDANYTQNDLGGRYAPCSVPGSLVWFQAGKYSPYNDGQGTKYNTVTFFLLEDGYIKVGVQKTKAKSCDSFMATNFKMYYKGEAGEAAQLAMALEELDEVFAKTNTLIDEIRNANYGSLASLLEDEMLELDYDEENVEEVQGAVKQLNNIYAKYQEYLNEAKQLSSLITAVEGIVASTNYPNKSDLQEALEKAQGVANDGNEGEVTLDGPEDYGKAYSDLSKARSTYIMGQDPVDGAINLSTLITTPFFCDAQYTPQWNAEANEYQFPLEELENTWATIQETGYSEVLTNNPEWVPIVNDFKLYQGEEPENQWIMRSTTWHGGGAIGVTMQHSYPALGGWTAEPTGNPELLYQHITDLPNGYYSMSALMCNAGADISELQYAYIETSDAKETAPLTKKGNPWWGGDKTSWRSGVWEKLQTGMLEVTDGTVTIGTSSDAFYAATGFQLYYYGTTPDFTAMIQPSLDAANQAINEKLTWPGDITNAKAILAEITLPIQSYEDYSAAQMVVAEANTYINTAYNTINNFSALENYMTLQSAYEESSDNYLIIDPALNYVLNLGEGENDTYEDANEATAVYNAYNEYIALRDRAATFESAEINTLLNDQATVLKAKYSSVEELNTFMEALQTPINKAVFAQLGADSANESNPVDVSVLMVNPSFQYGPNYGWTGELLEGGTVYASVNDYGREAAEIWNQAPFDFYQVVRALPAGAYEVRCRGLYREGGNVGSATSGAYYNWWYAAGAETELWENKNAVLYINNGEKEATSYVKSVCDGQFTEPSFVGYFQITDAGYTVGNNGNFLFLEELTDEDRAGYIDPETQDVMYDTDKTLDQENPAYPFDEKVVDDEQIYWYPSSMAGVYQRFKQSPEAYCNSVQIMVEEGGTLRIGLRKDAAISSDWLIFDDFQLLYLGTATPSAIENTGVNSEESVVKSYNLAGQIVNNSYKGIVIKNGKKVLNK